MRFYSIIIPVYNRPDEIDELLKSLLSQSVKNFEVLVIEDGSDLKCETVVEKYQDKLNIKYYYKENSGQGFTRNYGFERANGDYFIIFDSDCLIPENYLHVVDDYIEKHKIDAFGGPDRAAKSFTAVQKAINYSMTSPFTTGGIRGQKKHIGQFHPRSFNMGLSRQIYEQLGGFRITRMAEDLEYSIRIIRAGFKVMLVPDAYVYHKRRTNFSQFFKQLHFFGKARINLSRFYPEELKVIHAFPAAFITGFFMLLPLYFVQKEIFTLAFGLFIIYFLLIFFHSLLKNRQTKVAFLSVFAAFIQLSAYGLGFITEGIRKLMQQ